MSLTSSAIKARALEVGFDLCGVAAAGDLPELGFLREWIDQGHAGEMRYLERSAAPRADVRRVLPSARSVIVLATLYNTDRPYSTEVTDEGRAEVSRYAWGDDYHEVLGRRVGQLLEWMRAESDEPFEAKWYVDTGPVQERVYARHAGLGWIGKNTCLINPTLGSWLFLSELIVSVPLDADAPGLDRCGSCTLCLEACPTSALVGPHVLDATRCISYLTIELKGAIPESHRDAIGRHVYGCDICQEVCPWNLHAAVSIRTEWQPRAEFDRPRLAELWRASDDRLREALRGSAMTRARLTGIRRNVAVAIGNSGDPQAAPAFDETGGAGDACSASRQDPTVREHVEWAKRRLKRRSRE
jgi:epoxyqueuosine reductase